MNPIGSANKYLKIAVYEYGLDDFSVVSEICAENDRLMGRDPFVSEAMGSANIWANIGKGVVKGVGWISKNKDAIKTVAETTSHVASAAGDVSSAVKSAKETTAKGRGRYEAGQEAMANATTNEEKKDAAFETVMGGLQMSLGEMRRQLAMSGMSDPDVQLEVIRNAFAKQYYDMPATKSLKRAALKKTIAKMDEQLASSFTLRNQQRASQGLEPLVPSSYKPTFEYKV